MAGFFTWLRAAVAYLRERIRGPYRKRVRLRLPIVHLPTLKMPQSHGQEPVASDPDHKRRRGSGTAGLLPWAPAAPLNLHEDVSATADVVADVMTDGPAANRAQGEHQRSKRADDAGQ